MGIFFGVVLIKSEAMTWVRIQEMFRFQDIHMYGIFGTAVLVGGLTIILIKRLNLKTIDGELINLQMKPFNKVANFAGGVSFGLGWALTGTCIAPIYVLAGSGYIAAIIILIFALLGTFVYGVVRDKLPR